MCSAKTICFYYPTTVVIVDDNRSFLENLPENLNNGTLYKLFDSPTEALKFLEPQRKHLPTPEDFLGATDDLATGESLNVDIPKIHRLLYDKNRFTSPLVVIVDHDMPDMSGLEFCRKLADYPIKKIMLTGAADHKLAVEAFNDGIINKFISKDDSKVFEAIKQAIHTLQQEYFTSLSETIIKNISTISSSLLSNKTFQVFFKNFIIENNIIEFYLTDAVGSFLLLNNNNELIWLLVQSYQEIENYRQTAEDHDAPAKIINAIANKEKLLCLFSEEDFNQPVSKWANYLQPANPIPGITNAFYSVIIGKKAYELTNIKQQDIYLFNLKTRG